MKSYAISMVLGCLFAACSREPREREAKPKLEELRKYKLERVGPANAVQLYADGFEHLSPQEKIFIYYLSLAALAGRDIAVDQHHHQALEVRRLFEQIHQHATGIDSTLQQKLDDYLKLFWIDNGFYDDLTSKKFVPQCSFEEFKKACSIAAQNGAQFDLMGESLEHKLEGLRPIIFDQAYDAVMTDKTPGADLVAGSAVNFYSRNLTFKEIQQWSKSGNEKYPLNSFVAKENGKIVEKVWRAGGAGAAPGKYAADLKAVIKYLEMAIPYASSDYQAETVRKLVRFFQTGSLEDFRQYNIHWVKDNSNVDFIMGFIEVYLDPRGQKAEWEASIFYTDPEQTKLMRNLAQFAQYFEDKAPWRDEFKKKIEHSPIANVINVVMSTGGTGPISPIGINLPNEQAIRQQYGSKSVLLHNIVDAYEKSQGRVLVKEFAWDPEEAQLEDRYGSLADNLHTAMHEVIGHGSGKVSDKLKGKDPSDFLPGYYNTLEEARADLVALWNAWDDKLVDIGLAKDAGEARMIGETMLRQAVRVALTQLRRIGKSDQLSEDHMKNRALIGHYLISHSKGAKIEVRDGKTYYRIVDFEAVHKTVGELLAEVMRIKAEGDLPAAKALIDQYGLKVDPSLRDEVQERVKKLDIPSYTGFVMPHLEPVQDLQGKITDIKVTYSMDLLKQMLEYSSFTEGQK
jgi:dipeptidyl-peptidase-3